MGPSNATPPHNNTRASGSRGFRRRRQPARDGRAAPRIAASLWREADCGSVKTVGPLMRQAWLRARVAWQCKATTNVLSDAPRLRRCPASFGRDRQGAAAADHARLTRRGMTVSMSRKGDGSDHACNESWHRFVKKELMDLHNRRTRVGARTAIFDSVEILGSRHRLHVT